MGFRERQAMTLETKGACVETPITALNHDHRLEKLIDRLPGRMQTITRWLRRPNARWVRIPAGVLLICGGALSILPFLGLWMLPLGLMLLAEDFPPLRRARHRVLDWIERHRPHWFASDEEPRPTQAPQSNSSSSPAAAGEI
jgi:hypothetical protein